MAVRVQVPPRVQMQAKASAKRWFFCFRKLCQACLSKGVGNKKAAYNAGFCLFKMFGRDSSSEVR